MAKTVDDQKKATQKCTSVSEQLNNRRVYVFFFLLRVWDVWHVVPSVGCGPAEDWGGGVELRVGLAEGGGGEEEEEEEEEEGGDDERGCKLEKNRLTVF